MYSEQQAMRPCLLSFPSAFPASRLVPAALVLLAPAAHAASMGQVPAAVQTHIATFLGTRDTLNLLRASSGLRIPAGKGIRDFKLQGDLRAGQLTGLLARISQVEALVLGHTPNLRSEQLVEAISKLRHLKKLTILSDSSLEVAGVVAIARSLAESGFHSLCLHPGPHAMRSEDLAQLPETLQYLQVYGPDLVGPEFGRFSDLQRLTIRTSHRFKGRGLPPALRTLEVTECLGFEDGRELPVRLEKLTLRYLPAFHGPIHLPALRELNIRTCSRFTPDLCKAAVAAAPNLKSLTSDRLDQAVLEAAPAGLEVLQLLEGGASITDGLLSRFVQLRSLHLPHCRITGSGLPASLLELNLSYCAEFRTEALNTPSLHTLTLHNCPTATGAGLPAQLGRLNVAGCDAFPLSAVTRSLHRMDALRTLNFWTRFPALATPEDVAGLQPWLPRMGSCRVELAGAVKLVDHNVGRR